MHEGDGTVRSRTVDRSISERTSGTGSKQKITGTAIEGERKERYSADQTGNKRCI